ncbi:MAG: molybdenum cofactor guanylyltransferase [Desulfobulbaceae bacterium]|nr:MAG: molybdenum cofactor guanylyltransferase [Desulfobulbaceae bacterium]
MKPVYGAVLIGGKSSRMGRPKHLLAAPGGRTWLERSYRILADCVDHVVVSGSGVLPKSLEGLQIIADLPHIPGPLGGIAALLNSNRAVSWLVVACDMPYITEEAIKWVLAQRRTGSKAVIPRNAATEMDEPLFAWYDSSCRSLIDEMIAEGEYRPRCISSFDKVHRAAIPESLQVCWQNVNDPTSLKRLELD